MMAARWHAAPRPSGGLPRAESGRRCAPVRSHSPSPFPTSPGGVCSMPEHRSQSHLSAKSAWPSAPCASARRGTISDPPQPQVVPDTSAPASANLADLAESLPDNDCRYAGVLHLHKCIRLLGALRCPCSPPSALAFRHSLCRWRPVRADRSASTPLRAMRPAAKPAAASGARRVWFHRLLPGTP